MMKLFKVRKFLRSGLFGKLTNKNIVRGLKSYKIIGVTTFRRTDLFEISKLRNKTVKQLKKEAKELKKMGFPIKGVSKLKKNELVKQIYKKNKDLQRAINRIRRKFRGSRRVRLGKRIIFQEFWLTLYTLNKDGERIYKTIEQLETEDKDVKLLRYRHIFNIFLRDAQKSLYKDKTVKNAKLQALYGTSAFGSPMQILYTKPARTLKSNTPIEGNQPNLYISGGGAGTGVENIFLGYRIKFIMNKRKKPVKRLLDRLEAYHPSSNRKFHDNTICSTTTNKICIYETFMNIIGKLKLKYLGNKKNSNKQIYDMLNKEGYKIKKLVKKGLLIRSLKLLTKKYNTTILINFFRTYMENNKIIGQNPIEINKGHVKILNDITYINTLKGKKCMLYDKNTHVAPAIFNIPIKQNNKPSNFILRKNKLKGRKILINGVFGFDIKTTIDKNGEYKPIYITLYGKKDNKHIYKLFYSVNDFINYLDTICTKINNKKTRPHNKIGYIYIYGFNNSKLDNLFIFKEFKNLDPNVKYQFTSNKVLYIKYNNIKIHDVGTYYNIDNNLNATCREFKFKKDILRSRNIYKLAKEFIKDAKGTINKHKYNYLNSCSCPRIAIKLYTQVFQKYNLRETPPHINEIEQSIYYGGKCAVYKKHYIKNNDTLHYGDINSAHAASMTHEMPFKYIETMPYEDEPMTKDDIIPYNIYKSSVRYKGHDKYYIPNIIQRVNGEIIEVKNVTDVYLYGCELIEAINNNCIVMVTEEIMYEPKILFKEFSNYIYEQRLKYKHTNKAKYGFYKKILTGLYGKLGQRKFNKSCLCKDDDEMLSIIKDFNNIINYEEIGDMTLYEYKDPTAYNYNIGKLVRLPAYITALTRCNVSRAMRDIGHEHIYYSATDSIYSTKKLSDEFIDNDELGKWKYEDNQIIEGVFIAPNVYYIKDNKGELKKASGFKNKPTEKQYKDVLNNKNISVKENITLRTFKSIKTKTLTKSLKTGYNKRIFNGNDSQAIQSI